MNKILRVSAFTFVVLIAFESVTMAQVALQANEIAREGHFIAYDNGTVLDTQTGLLWAATDDGKGMVEQDALSYFENYRGGGYSDWRMPTVNELEAIYDRRTQNKQGYHVTKLIDITGEWVWCSEGPESVNIFNFRDGSRALAFFEGPGFGSWYSTEEPLFAANRALPVRNTSYTLEIAVFPWRFDLRPHSAIYANPVFTKTQSVDGLRQVLSEYKLVVPKFSYYDLGNQFNAKNIKDNPLTEAIVKDIWIKKGTFSTSRVNLDLICRLGRQLQVDAVLIYSIYIEPIKQNADIILIDIKAKKAYSKTERIYVRTLSIDIMDLTENFFIEYVNEKYKSHPNYEMIFWDFIKNSRNVKVFQQFLKKFPDGTFVDLAKLRIQNLSPKKP